MPEMIQFYPLSCGVQHYPWGCRLEAGHAPYIAELLGQEAGDRPWAELWLGAHPKLPAMTVLPDGTHVSLETLIQSSPVEMIGADAASSCGILPFLLKVLSCRSPLSIQSHPDKKTAVRLHREHPDWYPDDNHKPEMMLALTRFEALCGFRRCSEIEPDLARHGSLSVWLERWQESAAGQQGLKGLCQVLFDFSSDELSRLMLGLEQELSMEPANRSDADELFLRLIQVYPGDRGAFFAYLLNHITLNPGESVFVAANQPHAYLNGTGVECMANSDNVVRAGLTGKVVDVTNLMGTLDFFPEPFQMMKTFSPQAGVVCHVSPVDEFQVTALRGNLRYDWDGIGGQAAVVLVLQGHLKISDCNGRSVEGGKGCSWFKPAALKAATLETSDDAYVVLAISNI